MITYEICIENYYLLCVGMNWIILAMVQDILRIRCGRIRSLLGALLGGLPETATIFLGVWNSSEGGSGRLSAGIYYALLILFYMLADLIMVFYTYRVWHVKMLFCSMTCLLSGTLLLGGAITVVDRVCGLQSGFLVVGCSYAILWIRHRWNNRVRAYEQSGLCEVMLTIGNKQKKVIGFVDSGNRLREPISHSAVCVAEAEVLDDLLDWNAIERIRVIPYRSVGRENGILKAYRTDRLDIIHGSGLEERHWNVYVAISEHRLCRDGTYQLIVPENLEDNVVKGRNEDDNTGVVAGENHLSDSEA